MAPADGDEPRVPLDPDIDFGETEGPRTARTYDGPPPIMIAVTLALGGGLGAMSRYGIERALPTPTGHFPWSTFLINVSGSAALGFVLIVLIERFPDRHLARPLIGSGFIGAYTTFSTFIVEALLEIRDHRLGTAVVYLVSSVSVGLLAVVIGMHGARRVLPLRDRGRAATP
jgi:CrcB protein